MDSYWIPGNSKLQAFVWNKLLLKTEGLSESFEVDSWIVKVSGQSRGFLFKNAIHKEMPSRVAGRY